MRKPARSGACGRRKWTEHPWSPEVLDRLSQQEQMRLQLLVATNPPSASPSPIVDGPRIKLKHFDLVEAATLDTPSGAPQNGALPLDA